MSASGSSGLPNGELAQLVDVLIDNHKVKDILVKSIYVFFWKKINSSGRNTPNGAKNNSFNIVANKYIFLLYRRTNCIFDVHFREIRWQ